MGRGNICCHTRSYGEEYVAELKEYMSNRNIQVGNDVRFDNRAPSEPPVL